MNRGVNMFVAFVFDVHLGMTALQMDLDQEYCMNALIGREMLILWCFSLIECALANVDNLKMIYNALCCICNPCSIVFEAFLSRRLLLFPMILEIVSPQLRRSNLDSPRPVTDNPFVFLNTSLLYL